jgi:hypothetical protein
MKIRFRVFVGWRLLKNWVNYFNEVIDIVFGSNYLTANLLLPKLCRIKDVLANKSRD